MGEQPPPSPAMSHFNKFEDNTKESGGANYVSSNQMMPTGSSQRAPRNIIFTPTAVLISTVSLVLGLVCLTLAATEWSYHDVKGECKLIDSGQEYIDQIPGCNTAPKPSSFKDCIKKICKKDNDIYYGQCHAPGLAIAGGVLSMAAALITVAGWCYPDNRNAITVMVSLFSLAAFFVC